MADLNNGKGKFWGVDENVNYEGTFIGATKVAEKVKKGGTETKSDGYVVDAIDIDWGGLKLTTIDNGWSQKTISSIEQNAGKGENTQGIHSTAYLLNLISGSFDQIYNQIGGSDNAGLRKRIAGAEASIKAMANLSPTELTGIQNDLRLIKEELAGEPVNTWTTLVDKLAYLGNDTVKTYVDNAVAGAKTYADTKKTEAINAAASDAAAKANTALSNAKTYADTKKTEAINAAASDAAAKANTALSNAKTYADTKKKEAINAAASDAAAKDEQVKIDLTGSNENDTKDSITIWGARKHADEIENVVTAQADTWSRERANTAKTEAINAAASDATSKANTALSNAKAYADTKKTEAINAAASDATTKANTALSNAKAYADTKKTEAINAAASDATTKANKALSDANNYTNTKISEISQAAFKVSRIEEGNEGILVFSTVSSYAG